MKNLVQGCFITAALAACSREPPARDFLDLLTRSPEEHGEELGVRVDLAARRVRLEDGGTVRYRLEPLAPGGVQLAARASGEGTIEAAFVAIDRATGEEAPRESWRLELDEAETLARTFPWPCDGSLLELRLGWSAAPGEGALELEELFLVETAPVERPSIVLISIDTLSARHLSIHGYPIETAPALTRFASEAYVFEECLANSTWTVPSFMSLLTGLYPRSHELDDFGPELWEHWHMSQSRWTLAEFLRAAGYRTAGFVDNLWLTQQFGFDQGFEVYDASAGEATGPETGIRRTTAQAEAFLEQLGPAAPFFLFVHAFDVHGPYHKAPPLAEAADEAEHYDLAHTAPAGGPVAFGIIPTYIARSEVPEGEIPNPMHTGPLARNYDEGIRFVDTVLGEFFETLRANGTLERSWVIVTADHGETMADSEYLFGHGVFDQAVVHVPLLMRPPGGLAQSTRIRETVQLLDVYPTLVDLALPGTRHGQLHGRSLVRLMRGEVRPPRVVLSQGGIMRQAMLVTEGWKLVELEPTQETTEEALLTNERLTPEWFAATEERLRRGKRGPARARKLFAWKEDTELVRDLFERLPASGLTDGLFAEMRARAGYGSLLEYLQLGLGGRFYELYDLRNDPRGERDVASAHPEKLAEMKVLLAREKERSERARAQAVAPGRPVELPAQAVEALRALGYGGSRDE